MKLLVKYFLFFFLLFLIVSIAKQSHAQQGKIDSLKKQLLILNAKPQTYERDTSKITILSHLSREYAYISSYDSALQYANQAVQIIDSAFVIQSPEFKHGTFQEIDVWVNRKLFSALSNAYNNIGLVYTNQADYFMALDYFLKALKIDEELLKQASRKSDTNFIRKSKTGMARRLSNIGLVYANQGNYPQALDYDFRALKMKEALGDKRGIAITLGNIGIIYKAQNDYPKALDYYFRALRIDEELGNKRGMAFRLSSIGIAHLELADRIPNFDKDTKDSLFNKALDYYAKALKIDEELENKNGIARHFGNIGVVYAKQADCHPEEQDRLFHKALDYYHKALKMKEQIGEKDGIAIWLSNIGAAYVSLSRYSDAYHYLYRSLALADSIGKLIYVKDNYENLSELYEKANIPLPDSMGGKLLNMEQMRLRSKYYYQRYIAIRDTLFSEENKQQITRKEMNYEFEKKEAAIKVEHDKQMAIAAAESRKQRLFLWLIATVAIAMVVIATIIFRSLHVTRKQKRIIEKQKKIVDKKNEHITDSINYAKHIQESLLLSHEEVNALLPFESFIVYQPKDIVSGDFYWLSSVSIRGSTRYIVAVADCTGHGVPGGFLSMIGYMLLNEVINKKSITNPSEILKELHHGMYHTLHHDNDPFHSSDGMNISICTIEPTNKIITYAGAGHPLYIIRNENGKEDTASPFRTDVIKADNISLGDRMHWPGVITELSFTSHQIPLETGMRIYLSSDGYRDQFNKKLRQRMGSAQFGKLLLQSAPLPMNEQKEYLIKAFNNWMETDKQVDDVLVMGIQL